MGKSKLIQVDIKGYPIPLKVVAEPRSNGRVAFGKRHVILRYPDSLFAKSEAYYIEWATDWLENCHDKNPQAFVRYTGQNYGDGDTITIYQQTFKLHIDLVSSDKGFINVKKSDLYISIPDDLNLHDQVEMRRRLMSRFTAKYFLKDIKKRVNSINDQMFGKEIAAIRLKYNRSNWGSCSTKNNINLSTRLLLAPYEAIDYVIIHELCHLIEMNHSPAFYREVAKRCPDYRKQEAWLNSNYCDF